MSIRKLEPFWKYCRAPKNKKRKIAFHGGYGTNNFGDDIFLHILVRYFSKNFHFNNFVVFASFPENISKMFLSDEFCDSIHAINMTSSLT